MKMVIRRARISDLDGIARVHLDTWQSTYKGIVPAEHLAKMSYDKQIVWWQKFFAENGSKAFHFVAESDGVVVAIATGGAEREGSALYKGELWGIYVLEAWQRRGIGGRLVAAVVEELQRRGMNSMLVWVLKDNPYRTFYEKLGGVPAGEKEIVIGGRKLVELAYGWRDTGPLLGENKGDRNT